MPISQDVPDSPTDADDAAPVAPTIQGIDDGPSPLEQALQALQCGPGQSLADPGITLLSSAHLDMLYMSVILSDYGRFSTELDRSGRIIADREFRG